MSTNANGKRPIDAEERGESSHTKRPRNDRSFSPEIVKEQPITPSHASAPAPARATDPPPAANPDLGFNAFLNKYFATHSADDPMSRDCVAKFIETKMDYTGIGFADEVLEEIKEKGGNHPSNRAAQTIIDEEVCFKLSRLLMSIAQGSGNLPVTMRYLGQVAADQNQVQVGDRFEETVQNFLVDVGNLPADEIRASPERQIYILNVDDDTEDRPMKQEQPLSWNDSESSDDAASVVDGGRENEEQSAPSARSSSAQKSSCTSHSQCTCDTNNVQDIAPNLTKEQQRALFKTPTPLVNLFLKSSTGLEVDKSGRDKQIQKIFANLQARSDKLPSHKISFDSIMKNWKKKTRKTSAEVFKQQLKSAYGAAKKARRQKVENVLK